MARFNAVDLQSPFFPSHPTSLHKSFVRAVIFSDKGNPLDRICFGDDNKDYQAHAAPPFFLTVPCPQFARDF